MTGWWVHRLWNDSPVILFSWIFWVITSIVLHELGHGFAAVWQGDPTPRLRGRLTVNPVVHIPPFGWLLFAFAGITWGLMPIDPRLLRHGRASQALVTFAGPAVNLVLALVLLTALVFWQRYGPTSGAFADNFATFLIYGGLLNTLLFFFNLMPLPPLDGCMLLACAFRPVRRLLEDPRVWNVGFAALIILGLLGFFEFMSTFAAKAAGAYHDWLSRLVR